MKKSLKEKVESAKLKQSATRIGKDLLRCFARNISYQFDLNIKLMAEVIWCSKVRLKNISNLELYIFSLSNALLYILFYRHVLHDLPYR